MNMQDYLNMDQQLRYLSEQSGVSVEKIKNFLHHETSRLSKNDSLGSARGECEYCGLRAELTKDHIVPSTRGGAEASLMALKIIAYACKPCNSSKCDRIPSEWTKFRTFPKSNRAKILQKEKALINFLYPNVSYGDALIEYKKDYPWRRGESKVQKALKWLESKGNAYSSRKEILDGIGMPWDKSLFRNISQHNPPRFEWTGKPRKYRAIK